MPFDGQGEPAHEGGCAAISWLGETLPNVEGLMTSGARTRVEEAVTDGRPGVWLAGQLLLPPEAAADGTF